MTTLWEGAGSDSTGTITLRISEEPGGHVGVMLQPDGGTVVGLAITRTDVQQIRQALTSWLVEVAPTVGRP